VFSEQSEITNKMNIENLTERLFKNQAD